MMAEYDNAKFGLVAKLFPVPRASGEEGSAKLESHINNCMDNHDTSRRHKGLTTLCAQPCTRYPRQFPALVHLFIAGSMEATRWIMPREYSAPPGVRSTGLLAGTAVPPRLCGYPNPRDASDRSHPDARHSHLHPKTANRSQSHHGNTAELAPSSVPSDHFQQGRVTPRPDLNLPSIPLWRPTFQLIGNKAAMGMHNFLT